MLDDFDQPNTAPGYCPECGQPANIWEAVSQQWECSYCNWRGRKPNPKPPEYPILSTKEQPICRHCGSENVSLDAWAEWNTDTQQWELETTFDAAHCHNCEGETKLAWREIP